VLARTPFAKSHPQARRYQFLAAFHTSIVPRAVQESHRTFNPLQEQFLKYAITIFILFFYQKSNINVTENNKKYKIINKRDFKDE